MGYSGFDEAWILKNHARYKRWSEMYIDYKKDHPECDKPLKYFNAKCNELGLTHRYKPEHDAWLIENYADLGAKEAFDQFCKHFGVTKGFEGFKSHIKKLGLRCTKEQKQSRVQANRDPGNKPIGTIRHGSRQDFIKVASGTSGWIPLSHYVAGKPNKDEAVIHIDRNIRNNEAGNLMVVKRKALAMMTGFDMWSEHPVITKTGLLACELKCLLKEQEK